MDRNIERRLCLDDWLAHNSVLSRLNEVYSSDDVWMTYGSYKGSDGHKGCCAPYEPNVIKNNLFRRVRWRASHLRTMYAWLFKQIKVEDFYDPSGKMLDMAWDLSFKTTPISISSARPPSG